MTVIHAIELYFIPSLIVFLWVIWPARRPTSGLTANH